MLFATALIYTVKDPKMVSDALQQHLHFNLTQTLPTGIVLENGCMVLRLESGKSNQSIKLQLSCRDIYQQSAELLQSSDFQALDDIHVLDTTALEQNVDLCGLTLRLSQALTEDDLNITPDLPTRIAWQVETDALLKRLLKRVPLGFRSVARTRITRYSEELALETGTHKVTTEQLLPAIIAMTPPFRHTRLRKSFAAEGLDAEHLFTQE